MYRSFIFEGCKYPKQLPQSILPVADIFQKSGFLSSTLQARGSLFIYEHAASAGVV